MQEWFKARTIWGAAIETLSDAEAGRLMKAVWHYVATGEQSDVSGAERGIFALILMTLSQDEGYRAEISRKRADAGSMGGKQKVANVANATFANQNVANVANANNKNKNKNKSEIEKETLLTECKEKKRFTPPTVEEVAEYCRERNNGIDAQTFVDFYQAKGWMIGKNPVRDWKACVRTWESNNRKNALPTKTVVAQQYEQRDYSSEQDEAMRRMLELGGTG